MSFLTYIGQAAERVISKEDLASLGADVHQLESLAEGTVLKFVHNVATEVDDKVAEFVASHPDLSNEFAKTPAPTVTEALAEVPPTIDKAADVPATTEKATETPMA